MRISFRSSGHLGEFINHTPPGSHITVSRINSMPRYQYDPALRLDRPMKPLNITPINGEVESLIPRTILRPMISGTLGKTSP